MKRQMTKRWRRLVAGAGLLLPGLLTGCESTGSNQWWWPDNFAAVLPGAQPAPNGTYVRRFQEVQAAKAEADDFVVYKYEWFMGGQELGPFGRYHLNEMIKRLPFVPFPILIQVHTADAQLNECRRLLIVQALAMNGIPDAEQRVVLGFPEAEGLYGEEAELIYQDMLTVEQENALNAGGYGGLGGFGGGFGGGYGGGGGFGSPFNQFVPTGGFGGFGGFGGGGRR